jgi:hypothetical protein
VTEFNAAVSEEARILAITNIVLNIMNVIIIIPRLLKIIAFTTNDRLDLSSER